MSSRTAPAQSDICDQRIGSGDFLYKPGVADVLITHRLELLLMIFSSLNNPTAGFFDDGKDTALHELPYERIHETK